MTQNQIAYHNAKELERHNKMTEQETNRHQLMTEALSRWSNALTNYQIAVNNAHYVRMDAETERANRAREAQNMIGLGETQRSNLANEDIRRQANSIQAAQVAETSRHQKAMENLQKQLNASTISKNQAEISYTSANTGYVQERTRSEGVYRTIILPQQADSYNADANLKRQQLTTESTRAYNNVMSGTGSVINSLSNAFRAVTGGLPAPSGLNPVQSSFETILNSL